MSEEVTQNTEAEVKQDAPVEKTPKTEAPKEEAKKEVKVPKEFKSIIEGVEKLSVLELNELVKVFEEKFGVSASAVAVGGAGGGDAGGDAGAESSTVNIELTSAGDQKIAIIKAVKELTGAGLKEAKDLVDGAPAVIKEGVDRKEAEAIKADIESKGGSVTLK